MDWVDVCDEISTVGIREERDLVGHGMRGFVSKFCLGSMCLSIILLAI